MSTRGLFRELLRRHRQGFDVVIQNHLAMFWFDAIYAGAMGRFFSDSTYERQNRFPVCRGLPNTIETMLHYGEIAEDFGALWGLNDRQDPERNWFRKHRFYLVKDVDPLDLTVAQARLMDDVIAWVCGISMLSLLPMDAFLESVGNGCKLVPEQCARLRPYEPVTAFEKAVGQVYRPAK